MNPDWSLTTLSTPVPFDRDGRHFGDLRLVHSNNRYAAGYIPIPLAVLRHGDGPTLLLTGGTHGDEYEGPAAILRLVHDLDLTTLRGRISRLVVNDIGPTLPPGAAERIRSYVGAPPQFARVSELETYLRQVYAPFGALTDAQWRRMTETSVRRRQNGYITALRSHA